MNSEASRRFSQLVPPAELNLCFGGGDFFKIGEHHVQLMQQYADLTPESRVLDVGCGAGRIAYALAQVLNENGSYHGFDNFPSGVAWCQEHYAKVLPNFHFNHVDVYNSVYYPYGSIAPRDFVFPYEDNFFDLAILNSVFTHMFPADVAHYMQELQRVLQIGGTSYTTWFLITDSNRDAVRKGQTNPPLPHRFSSFYVQDLHSVEDAVGYEETFVLNLLSGHGMAVKTLLPGNWRKQGAKNKQDIIVAKRL